jgi:hypothetical protein
VFNFFQDGLSAGEAVAPEIEKMKIKDVSPTDV